MSNFSLLLALAPVLLSASDALSVAQILGAPDQYVGRQIQVSGTLRIVPLYSRLPCPGGEQPCNPITSVSVFLQDSGDSTKQLLLYQGGNPYRCSYDLRGSYSCPPLTDKAPMVLQGTFSKGKEPAGITGSASPGGGGTPPKVTVFKEFYFFDISSSSTEPHPAKRKAK